MIEVSVEPNRLVVGRRTQLAIRFANTGQRACSGIVFKLRLPSAITLTGGTNPAEIPVIPPGRVHAHEVTVEPTKAGEFELTSTNFSYRDEFDVPVRVTDFRARLSVESAPPARPKPARPVARLGVEHADRELALGEWDVLRILVQNNTGARLSDVTVAVSGPFKSDGKRARIAVLGDGATARFPFKVKADEGGRHVPVSVHTTYSYPDDLGSVRSQTQEDSLDVVVAKPGAPDAQLVTANGGEVAHPAVTPPGTARPRRIFISYRRDESSYPASWLFDRLTEHFGEAEVFKDVDSIQLGDDFAEAIASAVESCDVLLVLIGDHWLTITDDGGQRRLDDPNDFVRLEIEAALNRKIRVIPVLIGGARMPRANDLPASLSKLARRQALELSPNRFRSDTGRLLEVLDITLSEV